MKRNHTFAWTTLTMFFGGFALLLVSSSPVIDGAASVLILISLVFIAFAFARQGWRLLRSFNQDLNTAARPVMSPQEINQRFIAETGRAPTVEEVAAIQQMLHNERNDARVNAGLGIAALLLIGRDL